MNDIMFQRRNQMHLCLSTTKKVLCLVVHLQKQDLPWFDKDKLNELLDEINSSSSLLREMALNDGDDTAKSKVSKPTAGLVTGKRARPGELPCIQAKTLQFTYHFRKTQPTFSFFVPQDQEQPSKSFGRNIPQVKSINNADGATKFHNLAVSDTSLLVWVYRYDPKDPYAPLSKDGSGTIPITSYFQQKRQKNVDVSDPIGSHSSDVAGTRSSENKDSDTMADRDGSNGDKKTAIPDGTRVCHDFQHDDDRHHNSMSDNKNSKKCPFVEKDSAFTPHTHQHAAGVQNTSKKQAIISITDDDDDDDDDDKKSKGNNNQQKRRDGDGLFRDAASSSSVKVTAEEQEQNDIQRAIKLSLET